MNWFYWALLGGYILCKIFSEEETNKYSVSNITQKKDTLPYSDKTLSRDDVQGDTSKICPSGENNAEHGFKTSKECFEAEYVSYSRIATYYTCPQRFKLIYLDKCEPDSDSYIRYEKGKAFHKAVECILRMKPFDSNKILTELDYKEIVNWGYTLGYLDRSKSRWFEWERVRNREKTKNFRNMAKFFCETLPQDVEITAIEKELRFKAEGINIFGIVDLVLKYPDGHIEIVDYKTGMRRPTKEQLEIYAIPFSEDSKRQLPISFRVICPDRKSHYLWTLSPEKVEEKRERILDMVRVILNDTEFKPTSLAVCRDCGVKNACNYGGKKSLPTEGENIRPFDLTRLSRTYEWKPAPVGCRTTKSRRPYLSKATKSS